MNKNNYFFIKVVSDLKFGHFYFSWPPLKSATSDVRWKTSDIISCSTATAAIEVYQQRKLVVNSLVVPATKESLLEARAEILIKISLCFFGTF